MKSNVYHIEYPWGCVMKSNKMVLINYLIENINFNSKISWVDAFHHIAENYETVPDEILTAYEDISEYEMWDIVRLLAVKGKKQTKELQ